MTRALELARERGDRREILAAVGWYALALSGHGQIAEGAAVLEPAREEYRDLVETQECGELGGGLDELLVEGNHAPFTEYRL